MIIRLNSDESNTLDVLDPRGKGPKNWVNARSVAIELFPKVESVWQKEIRNVRNAFRKLIREKLVEATSDKRGQYRITEKGRKIRNNDSMEFEGLYKRGETVKATQDQTLARAKLLPAPKTTKKGRAISKARKKAKKKVVKKIMKMVEAMKAAVAEKAAKVEKAAKAAKAAKATKVEKASPKSKKVPKKKASSGVKAVGKATKKPSSPFTKAESRGDEKATGSDGGNGEPSNTGRRTFKRRQAPAAYGETQSD